MLTLYACLTRSQNPTRMLNNKIANNASTCIVVNNYTRMREYVTKLQLLPGLRSTLVLLSAYIPSFLDQGIYSHTVGIHTEASSRT